MALVVPFKPRINGGGVITYRGASSGIVVYWFLVGWNPETEEEVEPVGTLSETLTITDKSRCTVNRYISPTSDPGVIYDKVRIKTLT